MDALNPRARAPAIIPAEAVRVEAPEDDLEDADMPEMIAPADSDDEDELTLHALRAHVRAAVRRLPGNAPAPVIIPAEAVHIVVADDADGVAPVAEPETVPQPAKKKETRGRKAKPIPVVSDILGAEVGMDYSLTCVSRGKHVPPFWLRALFEFCKEYGIRCSLSLERGGKQEMLHIQAVVTFLMDPTPENIEAMKKFMKAALGVKVGDGSKWCAPAAESARSILYYRTY